MLIIESQDFCPVNTFVLQWRWTNPKRIVLDEDVLSAIKPLNAEKAGDIYKHVAYSKEYTELEAGFYPPQLFNQFSQIQSSFAFIKRFHVSKMSSSTVQDLLATLDIENDTQVFVSWESPIAIITTWEVISHHWYDFCYPSSDDVTIAPLSEKWLILWHHDEYIVFGKK